MFDYRIKNNDTYLEKFEEMAAMYRYCGDIDTLQRWKIILQKAIPIYKF